MPIFNINVWIILIIIALIALILSWKTKNAIWGGLTIGGVIGLVVAIVFLLIGKGFHWSFIQTGMIIGTLIGVLAECLARLSSFLKNRSKKMENAFISNIDESKIEGEEFVYFKKGKQSYFNKQIDEALNYFDLAFENGFVGNCKNDMFELYDLRARCLQELGFEYDAIENFDKAISFSPHDCNEYYARSLSKAAILDFEGEIADLEKANELSKADTILNRAYNEEAIKMGYCNGASGPILMRLRRAKMDLEFEMKERDILLNAPTERKVDIERTLHEFKESRLKGIKRRNE